MRQPGGAESATTLRRDVLKFLAGGFGLAILEGCPPPSPATRPPIDKLLPKAERRNYQEVFCRREDMTWMHVVFDGFYRDGNQLLRFADNAFVIVTLAPQALGEQTIDDGVPAPTTIQARLAEPTVLAFRIPDATQQLTLSVATLLDWSRLEYRAFDYTPGAYVPSPPSDDPPSTHIEIPLHIVLTPLAASWSHAVEPVAGRQDPPSLQRYELWTTRLGTRSSPVLVAGESVETQAVARWTSDYASYQYGTPATPAPKPICRGPVADPEPLIPDHFEPYTTSFTPAAAGPADYKQQTLRVRREIVDQSLGTGAYACKSTNPLRIDELTLSSLGGWLKVRGDWNPPTGTPIQLEAWRHVVSQGREQSAEVIDKCFLFPFGHRASMVAQTLREFDVASGVPETLLRRRKFILVREPERSFADLNAIAHPTVRIMLERTTPITLTQVGQVYVVRDAATNALLGFPLQFTDHDKRVTGVVAPLLVVPNNVAQSLDLNAANKTLAQTLEEFHHGTGRRHFDFNGQLVAFAPKEKLLQHIADGAVTVDASLQTTSILYGADSYVPAKDLWTHKVLMARVTHPSVSALIKQGADIGVNYLDAYALKGFESASDAHTVLGAFAQLVDPDWDPRQPTLTPKLTPLSLNFSPSPTAAPVSIQLATPNIDAAIVSGLRGLLPSASLPTKTPQIVPGDFFNNAKLFGNVSLGEIVKQLPVPDLSKPAKALNGGAIPGLVTRREGDKIITTYDWETKELKGSSEGFFEAISGSTTLHIHAEITADLRQSHTTLSCTISDFKLNLLGSANKFLTVHFRNLVLQKDDDSPPHVTINVASVELTGALAFLGEIQRAAEQALSLATGANLRLPTVSVDGAGIAIDHCIALPGVSTPSFSLANLSFRVGLDLPFTGEPALIRFGFADPANRFVVAVSLLGGGGYFLAHIRPPGLKGGGFQIDKLEGAVEFGGILRIALTVADGEVHALAGIYFQKSGGLTLSGYIRCGGSLKILGLLTIRVEFYLSLTYDSSGAGDSLTGLARMTVSVEAFFFSVSVSFEVRHCVSLSGRGCQALTSIPAAALAENEWRSYCAAFA